MTTTTVVLVLGVTTIACLGMVTWLFLQARRGGFDKAVRKELHEDLERTKEALDILSGPVPSPRRSLDILSNKKSRANGALPADERDHTTSVRGGLRP